jgi:5'(3')-deoxyribonucleotidase
MSKQTIAIDFDGVLHKYSKGWHDGTIYDVPVEGSLEAVKELSKKYDIVVFTARLANLDRDEFQKQNYQLACWLVKHGISKYISHLTGSKPKAMIYIDDRALHFTNWKSALKETKERLK